MSVIGAVDKQQYRPTLIQVVARRTAEPDGVTDYALALARALRAYKGVNSVFLSGTASVDAMPVEDDWKTVCVPMRKAQILADTIQLLSAETNAALWFYIFLAMAIRSEVSRYGWIKASEFGAVVPAACRFSPSSMSSTRLGDLGKPHFGYPRFRGRSRAAFSI